ncbi:MAG: cytidine deaminase, partial [Pygmaiobacter sp.]
MDKKALIEQAVAARAYAYAPYSHFQVGAALLC